MVIDLLLDVLEVVGYNFPEKVYIIKKEGGEVKNPLSKRFII